MPAPFVVAAAAIVPPPAITVKVTAAPETALPKRSTTCTKSGCANGSPTSPRWASPPSRTIEAGLPAWVVAMKSTAIDGVAESRARSMLMPTLVPSVQVPARTTPSTSEVTACPRTLPAPPASSNVTETLPTGTPRESSTRAIGAGATTLPATATMSVDVRATSCAGTMGDTGSRESPQAATPARTMAHKARARRSFRTRRRVAHRSDSGIVLSSAVVSCGAVFTASPRATRLPDSYQHQKPRCRGHSNGDPHTRRRGGLAHFRPLVRLVRGRDRQTLELRPPGTSAHPGISVTHVPGILCYLCPRLLTLPRNIRPHGRIPARKRVACEADCRSGQRAAGSGNMTSVPSDALELLYQKRTEPSAAKRWRDLSGQ